MAVQSFKLSPLKNTLKNRLFQIGTFLLLLVSGISLQAQVKLDPIAFGLFSGSRKFNFDTLQTDTSYHIILRMRNDSDLPINELYIKNSGGCLYATVDGRQPLLAGESREIDIAINTNKKVGNNRKAIVIYTDNPDESIIPVVSTFVIVPKGKGIKTP